LNRYQIWPFSSFSENWIIAASVAFVGGSVILFVCLAEQLFAWTRENKATAQSRQLKLAQHNTSEKEAVHNLALLERNERTALAYIFRTGQKRFRGQARYKELGALADKEIIGQPMSSNASDVWVVRDSVWALREDLLRTWTDIHAPNSPPWHSL
jgi:hypothetical protein